MYITNAQTQCFSVALDQSIEPDGSQTELIEVAQIALESNRNQWLRQWND